jgi:phosphomannomutase
MPSAHHFHPSVLREYDIRGIVGETLSAADAYALGLAFGTVVRDAGGASVVTGYDGRLSSPELENSLVDGLRDCGLGVWRIGRGPTPMLYYAVHIFGAGGGVMVTGSHNPPSHNGFKMMLGTASYHGDSIRQLGRIAATGSFAMAPGGEVGNRPVMESYVERLVQDCGDGKGRPLKVAWDAGNGAAGDVMTRLVRRLPGQHVLLNQEVNGRFPAHHPDPSVAANLRQLQECVAANNCDVGIAFDGDGDRIGVVDGHGDILWGDQILALLAREVLARHPGATIIGDVKSSRVLFDEIARAGGVPLMWRTGHSLIKAKMTEVGAPLAGELSGHIFYSDDYYGFDDALYAAVRLLRILAHSPQSLAEMRAALPAMVNTPELRLACSDERKFAVVEEVKARQRSAGVTINDIDGVRVENAEGWWLLRASNTQAGLVVRCEAQDQRGLDHLMKVVAGELRTSGLEPRFET